MITTVFVSPHLWAVWDEYIIGPGDILDIVVEKDDNLTKEVTVDKDGNIVLAYLNQVKVSGLNYQQAADLIANRLKDEGFFIEPVVTVLVKEQKIYILGEIKNPGPYVIKRDKTVLEALSMAGGFTDFAKKGKVKIIRQGKKKPIIVNLNKILKGDTSADIKLQPGDVLVALRSWF